MYSHLPHIHPVLLIVMIVWILAWKGWALWEAARRGQKTWFVIIFIANTLGILEMIYLFFVTKAHKEHFEETLEKKPEIQ